MWKFLLLGVAGLLSACAPPVFNKPGATQQDFATDKYSCERDSRQSGGFSGGIAGAIEIQQYFNRCMAAHGWTIQGTAEQAAVAADAQNKKSRVEQAGNQFKQCIIDLRRKAKYQIISNHFSNLDSGTYTLSQKADAKIPNTTESSILINYTEQQNICRSTLISTISDVSPAAGQVLQKAQMDGDAITVRLARQQISWGEAATLQEQLGQEVKTKLSNIHN